MAHAQHDAAVGAFLEHKPGQHRSQHRLQIQKQRCSGGRGVREPHHQQERPQHPAKRNRTQQPGPFAGGHIHSFPSPVAQQARDAQAQAAAQVQQAGQEKWKRQARAVANELLGKRRTGSKQNGCSQGRPGSAVESSHLAVFLLMQLIDCW